MVEFLASLQIYELVFWANVLVCVCLGVVILKDLFKTITEELKGDYEKS